ncbi:MAG: hypothetical protein ACT4O6_16655 [Reyranella sp.]
MIDTTDVNPIVMASCIAWAKRWDAGGGTFPPKIKNNIEQLIGLRARYARRPGAEGGGTADTEVPGYVVVEFAGRRVRVPYHLVDALPPNDVLEQMFQLASHVRLSEDSQMCLSGSAVFGGRVSSIADIDFCEYIPVQPATARSVLGSRCANVRPTLFVAGRIDEDKFDRLRTQTHPSVLDGIDKASTAKLDYVCHLEPFIGPLSNLSLFIDPSRPEAGSAKNSWPHQEVVLGEAPPLYPLMRPELLGRYMLWLREEIGKHIESRPVKAVKRSLSLSRVLGTGHRELYSTLEQVELGAAQRRKSLLEALEMAQATETAGGGAAVKELEGLVAKLPPESLPDLSVAMENKCREVARQFCADVDEMVHLAGRLLDGGK